MVLTHLLIYTKLKPMQKFDMTNWTIFASAAALLGLSIAVAAAFLVFTNTATAPVVQQEVAEPIAIDDNTVIPAEAGIQFHEDGSIDTSNWKTYRNEEYGFEVKYPPYYFHSVEASGKNVSIKANPETAAVDIDVNERIAVLKYDVYIDEISDVEKVTKEEFFESDKFKGVLIRQEAGYVGTGFMLRIFAEGTNVDLYSEIQGDLMEKILRQVYSSFKKY